MSSSARWQRVSRLFDQALALPPAERRAFVEQESDQDADLLDEVMELLAAHEGEDELPGVVTVPGPSGQPVTGSSTERLDGLEGEIPRHRLMKVLGEGGMGTVYLAEQTQPVKREVAVKLLKPGLETSEILARFEAERQALALMKHPNIATVLDGGLSTSGRPFFSMEWVEGIPIDRFCDERRLTLEERIRLFIQVCDGVQHAHQKGVIHRDLKPSNVLVTEEDGQGIAKVIDFGIAKAVVGRLGEATLRTSHGLFMGTPEYMSPEQAHPLVSDIDTRSDVFSLGVLLYQLTVGSLPFESEVLRRSSVSEILKTIETVDPPRPSARVASLGGERLERVLEARQVGRSELHRELLRDLDWIILRAMEKDRERRYPAVSELAADLERYLEHEPVVAGPPSAVYRVRKWVRRHRVAAAAGAVTLLLSLGFGTVMWIQANRLARARDDAELQLERVRSVSDFLGNVFTLADPGATRANQISARDVLDRGAERVRNDLGDDPQTQADLLETLADVYTRIGLFDEARGLQSDALALRERLAGEANDAAELELATALTRLGVIEARSQSFDAAQPLLERGLEIRRRIAGEGSLEVADSLGSLGRLALQRGEYETALDLFRRSVELRRPLEDPPSEELIAILGNSGGMLVRLGRHAEARAPLEEALALVREHYPENQRLVFGLQNSLISVERETGNLDAVLPLARTNLELGLAMYGEEHPFVLSGLINLATELGRVGRVEEAIHYAERALEGNRSVYGDRSPPTINAAAQLARLLGRVGELESCVERGREVSSVLDQVQEEAPRIAANRWDVTEILGLCLTELGELAAGERELRDSLRIAEALEDDLKIGESRSVLGLNLLRQERYEEAEPHAVEGYRGLLDTPSESPQQLETVIELYERWGKPERAGEYRALEVEESSELRAQE